MFDRVSEKSTVIAYASQSGTAASIANQFYQGNEGYCVLKNLAEMMPYDLANCGNVVFILATYGNGEPPNEVQAFFEQFCSHSQNLAHMQFSILALGDKQYPRFCGFGHHFYNVLLERAATPLVPLVEVNRADPATIQHWWGKVCDKFALKVVDHEQTWPIATVMDNYCFYPDKREPQHCVQLYVPNFNHVPGDCLVVRPPDCRVDLASLSHLKQSTLPIISSPDSQFIAVIPHAKSLYRCEPGDKWQVSLVANPYFRAPDDDVPIVLFTQFPALSACIGIIQAIQFHNRKSPLWLIVGPDDTNVQLRRVLTDFLVENGLKLRGQHQLSWVNGDAPISQTIQQESTLLDNLLNRQNGHVFIAGESSEFIDEIDASLSAVTRHNNNQAIHTLLVNAN